MSGFLTKTNPETSAEAAAKVDRYDWQPLLADAPRIRMVATDTLRVDQTYQREHVAEQVVLSIARDFDWALFGAISVADRAGVLYVTDGQHRLAAAKRRGVAKVPCLVTVSAGMPAEAAAFLGINQNRKCVSATQKFRAMLAAGDPTYVAAAAMLAELDMRVQQESGPQYMAFPSLLVKTYTADAAVCHRCLIFQREAIGLHDPLHNYVHKGLFYIATHAKSGDIFEHGQKILRAGGLNALLLAIRSAALCAGRAGVSDRIAALGVLEVVNPGLRTHRVTL